MKKRIGTILICILLIVSSLVIYPIKALKVNGNTLYVGGNGSGNYTWIQDAINAADPGDTIYVYNGTYYEFLIIDKDNISLVGEDRNTTIISVNSTYHGIDILTNSICIEEFTLQNTRHAFVIMTLPMVNHRNIHIFNCILNDGGGGIRLYNVSNGTVSNCFFWNLTGPSIMFSQSENLSINNCIITNNGFQDTYIVPGGIFSDEYNANISICYNNIFYNTGDGILVFSSKNVNISHNNIYGNSDEGIVLSSTINCEIHHNSITVNKGQGILIYGTYSSKININQNIISYNGAGSIYDAGIYLSDCSNCVIIQNNNISFNDPSGIYIIRSLNNIISYNNFIANILHVAFIDSIFNKYSRNYWDDWKGLGPKLIVGEISFSLIPWYSFSWFNFDWHPAKKPYNIS